MAGGNKSNSPKFKKRKAQERANERLKRRQDARGRRGRRS